VSSIYCGYRTSEPAQVIVRANKKSSYLCTPLAYNRFMEFIESHTFEKQVNALLSDDEFALFQGFLFSNPKARRRDSTNWRTTQSSLGGPRKRQIYFYVTAAAQIRLIAIYKKGIKDDLSAAEKKILKKLNENW